MGNPIRQFFASMAPVPSLIRLWLGVAVAAGSAGFILDNLNVSKNSSKGQLGLTLVTLAFAMLVSGALGLSRQPSLLGTPAWLRPARTRTAMIILAFLALGGSLYIPVDRYLLTQWTRSAVRFDRACYGALSNLSLAHRALRRGEYSSASSQLRGAMSDIATLGDTRGNCDEFEPKLAAWVWHLSWSTPGMHGKKGSWMARWQSDLRTFSQDSRPEMQAFFNAYRETRPLLSNLAERIRETGTVENSGDGLEPPLSARIQDASLSPDGELAFTVKENGQRVVLSPQVDGRSVTFRCRATPAESAPSVCRDAPAIPVY